MKHCLQEFFWTPDELVAWLRTICRRLGLWLVIWPVGEDARTIDPEKVSAESFSSTREDAIQLFLGSPDVSGGPVWHYVNNQRLVEFQASYAVQLVPSIVTPDGGVLLQGRIGILRSDQYDDTERAHKLELFFRRLCSELKSSSDAGHCIVQDLPNGERKRWKSMLVGRAVVGSNIRLKQFANGAVTFTIDTA